MWLRVKDAAEDGLVLGVKIAVVALCLVTALAWFLGDYNSVRQLAQHGEAAYQAILKAQQQQQAAPAPAAAKP